MTKLFLIENNNFNIKISTKSEEVVLHDNFLEILFENKEKLCRKFDDIRGTFLIDHISIILIEPNSRLVVFSSTPSMEYNLISTGLWKFDNTFSVSYQEMNRFYSWDKSFDNRYFA